MRSQVILTIRTALLPNGISCTTNKRSGTSLFTSLRIITMLGSPHARLKYAAPILCFWSFHCSYSWSSILASLFLFSSSLSVPSRALPCCAFISSCFVFLVVLFAVIGSTVLVCSLPSVVLPVFHVIWKSYHTKYHIGSAIQEKKEQIPKTLRNHFCANTRTFFPALLLNGTPQAFRVQMPLLWSLRRLGWFNATGGTSQSF